MFYLLIYFKKGIKGLTELKTETGQFLGYTGCTDYKYWYLMTGTLLKCDYKKWSSTRERGWAKMDMGRGIKKFQKFVNV